LVLLKVFYTFQSKVYVLLRFYCFSLDLYEKTMFY